MLAFGKRAALVASVSVIGATLICAVLSVEKLWLDSTTLASQPNAGSLEIDWNNLRVFIPGNSAPAILSRDAAEIDDDEMVAGISVKDRFRAYRLADMITPATHVVNDVIERIPISVTYCNIRNCVRAFTRHNESNEPLDVWVHGLMDGKMLLSLDGVEFLQEAEVVPVDRMDVEVTSWKAWKTAHPQTDVFAGTNPWADAARRREELKNFAVTAPGIVRPFIESGRSATVTDAAEVIGISVNGRHRAYRVSAFCDPRGTVVNDVIGGTPVSVTYNHLNSCVRVFTKNDQLPKPLAIGIRGWKDGNLLLEIDGKILPQNSEEILSASLEPEVTTWKAWKTAHPKTEIYTGYAPAAGAAD